MKRSDEIASAIFYSKDEFVVTTLQAIKGIEILGNTDDKKFAIAYNFSAEATEVFKQNGFYWVQYSNFTWTDEQ